MESIEVTTAAGAPASFIRGGRTWHVAPEPVRWYERTDWWTTATRMPKGEMTLMDMEVWRVQARIGHNPRTPLVTFELVLGLDRVSWSERSMDAVAA
ncbi:hypothetical protein [Arthrobacter sp. GMC3]|uniref:hypothetical protein n=1 Tax=Arthrobacter sp. GMC3 TaxID=2058894 RepID=UPI000CE434F3|nr:hypothetical protein [Arthrobacter sp. GMC3]